MRILRLTVTRYLKAFREFKPEYKTTSIHQVWQESFRPKEIVSYEMLKQKIESTFTIIR
ncbi:MAG: hypothetical protein IPG02_15535 [Ignavibacteria bacterium]|nr:hypothetical protein [Ignavibacteria bacterium]